MRTGFAICAAMALSMSAAAAPACAQEHLMPEPSNFATPPDGFTVISDYNAMVLDAFRAVYAPDSEARMIGLPPFAPEFAIAILKGKGEHYRILSLTASVQLWNYSYVGVLQSGHVQGWDKDGRPIDENAEADALKSCLPADFHAVKMVRCESDLDRDLATRAIALWERMLVGAHYDPPKRSADGLYLVTLQGDSTNYHFSMPDGVDNMAAYTVSPDRDSAPALLVEVAEVLNDFCNKRVVASSVSVRIARLEARLGGAK